MSDRSMLGPADVTDDLLESMVADLFALPGSDVSLLHSTARAVDYTLPAITTAGRYWVEGAARTPAGDRPFRLFVKHVQSWQHHPFFAQVPVEHRAAAAASVPWRTEPLAYRSDLGDRLPEGLVMPRALGVVDLPDDAAAVWLEDVTAPPVAWDLERYRRAAYLLGRLAASRAVAELRNVGQFAWSLDHYVQGRVAMQVVPAIMDDAVWQHPLVAGSFDEKLRRRLRAAAAAVATLGEELKWYPVLAAHGDASPNNLLPGPSPNSFTLIDYGFWMPQPVGFDLGQLLVGDVQIGRRSPALLGETDAVIVEAYAEGLAAEGHDLPLDLIRRAHAVHLLIFTGLSALPVELLGDEVTPELQSTAADRAELARFCLDQVDATTAPDFRSCG
jgi:hypothetical protein